MKIKIIDLLVKIANNEEVPKKIKYSNVKLEYVEENGDYYNYYGRGLFEYKFGNCKNFLNDEVEIIEEPKKIEKLPKGITDNACATKDQRTIANKINELIDEINNLKEK